MEEKFIEYAPLIIVVLCFFLKNKIFVTPEQLLQTKAEILENIKKEYMTKEIAETIKQDIQEIKQQLNVISEHILNRNN